MSAQGVWSAKGAKWFGTRKARNVAKEAKRRREDAKVKTRKRDAIALLGAHAYNAVYAYYQ
jgi:hypothetical protein